MKILRIRNIPDNVHMALKIKAIEHKVSMEQYVLKLIEKDLALKEQR